MELKNSPIFSDTNLKLYFRFEDPSGTTVTDSSSGGHNGTGSASSILGNIGGPFGQKAVFVAASSNKITLPNVADLKPTGNFSVGAWIRVNDISGDNRCIIEAYDQSVNISGFLFTLIQTTGVVRIQSGKNTGVGVGTDWQFLEGSTNVADHKWHHVVGTYDGSNLTIYVDGKKDGQVAWANGPAYVASPNMFVGVRDNVGSFWDGDLDDVFLLNGTALSLAQVNNLFIAGQAPALADTAINADTNLQLYYKFDDNGGTTVTDSSAGGHGGTASNASINSHNLLGMQGSAGVFVAASSNKVTATDTAALKPTGNFSAGFWFRAPVAPGAAQFIFTSYNDAGSKNAGWLFYMATTGKVQFLSGKNTGITIHTDYEQIGGNTNICDGVWHHVVGVWDGSNLNLYVDGKADATPVSWANAPGYQATNFVNVGCLDSGSLFLDGDLDELFLLNGTALNSQQINKLYNGLQGNVLSSVSDIAGEVGAVPAGILLLA